MAEIAGVALAVLPIVVNVAESFCTVQNIFKRFRGFGPEVKLFQLQLKIQRTIFREECRQLIARVAGQENVCTTASRTTMLFNDARLLGI